jgi:hypothetical protein
MKKLSLTLLFLLSASSYAQQPSSSNQSDCPDCEVMYYKTDQKKLAKLDGEIAEAQNKLDQDKQRMRELESREQGVTEEDVRPLQLTIAADVAAKDALQKRADLIQSREDSLLDSDCVDCQNTYYGTTNKRAALLMAPLNEIYWAELKKPNESVKECTADLEKGSVSAPALQHDDAQWLCKHRNKKEIAKFEAQSQQYQKEMKELYNAVAPYTSVTAGVLVGAPY